MTPYVAVKCDAVLYISQFHIYADDTSILYRDSDLNSVVSIVNQEMQKITEWFASNKLNVDVDKSVAMLFNPCQKIINTDDNTIKINSATVPFSISTKFFDMYIDNNFSWNAHTKHINKKNSNGVGVLSRLRNELPHKILLLIYNTLILPYLLLHNLGVYVQLVYQ